MYVKFEEWIVRKRDKQSQYIKRPSVTWMKKKTTKKYWTNEFEDLQTPQYCLPINRAAEQQIRPGSPHILLQQCSISFRGLRCHRGRLEWQMPSSTPQYNYKMTMWWLSFCSEKWCKITLCNDKPEDVFLNLPICRFAFVQICDLH